MNVYTVTPNQIEEGIVLADNQDVIALGETGCGRERTLVGIPEGAVVNIDDRRLMSIRSQTNGVVVLIRDHSGFRGSWGLVADSDKLIEFKRCKAEHAAAMEEWDQASLRTRNSTHPYGDQAIADAVISESGHRNDRVAGTECPACIAARDAARRVPLQVKILAQGWCGQGQAGHMGGGQEVLILIPEGNSVVIWRTGRLYRKPMLIWLICRDNQLSSVSDPRTPEVSSILSHI